MANEHHYTTELEWTGHGGVGTTDYKTYQRSHVIRIKGKPDLIATADPHFLGDPLLHNPEELLLAALSGCHMLTYLALCARARVIVVGYRDSASGTMMTDRVGGGAMTDVLLRPEVTVAEEAMIAKAMELHQPAHKYCFIANSVNFPVRHEAACRVAAK